MKVIDDLKKDASALAPYAGAHMCNRSYEDGYNAALEDVKRVLAWQPIETAPEGKDILVYVEKTGECFVVFWGTQVNTGDHAWVIARANDGTCFICKNPTHWMPLPQPPAETQE